MKIPLGKKTESEEELLGLFEPDEGSVNMYYGRIGSGKTYSATADILDLLSQGRVVYCNWHINYEGFDERNSFRHLFWKHLFFQKRFFYFPKENLHYFDPDSVDVNFLSSLNDCDIFVDEGQWIFDSYEGKEFSKEKRRLILHTRHLNRSINIISQRTQAIQISARGQVNRFYRCSVKMRWPFLIFRREEFQDMEANDVDESEDSLVSTKTYFANKKVLAAYDTKYLRAGVERSQKIYFDAYDLTFLDRLRAIYRVWFDPPSALAAEDQPQENPVDVEVVEEPLNDFEERWKMKNNLINPRIVRLKVTHLGLDI